MRVPTRFVWKYTLRLADLELGGINLDFAVEDDVLPSDEPTHEGDLVGEPQSIVAAPPQGDLASVGFEKAGIANQTGARDVGVGDRHGSVRNKRTFVLAHAEPSMTIPLFPRAQLVREASLTVADLAEVENRTQVR